MIGARRVSKGALVLLACLAFLLFHWMESSIHLHPWYNEKLEAAALMKSALDLIHEEATGHGVTIDSRFDPNRTGIIGPEISSIVTDEGLLDAKLITTNPNFAAVMVDLLKQGGLQRGDLIAVSYTGSIPGANVALLAACEALGLKPLVISSVGASNWGATDPNFTWLDMESSLVKKGIFSYRSLATSLGGMGDTGQNLDEEGRKALRLAIKRNGVPLLYEDTLEKSVEKRLALYDKAAKGQPIKAFANVGGGIANLGSQSNGFLIPPGLNPSLNLALLYPRGTIYKMAERGIPIIQILNIGKIADAYSLPRYPVPAPRVGEGKVFYLGRYDSRVILGFTLLFLVLIVVVVEFDLLMSPRIGNFFNGNPFRKRKKSA